MPPEELLELLDELDDELELLEELDDELLLDELLEELDDELELDELDDELELLEELELLLVSQTAPVTGTTCATDPPFVPCTPNSTL